MRLWVGMLWTRMSWRRILELILQPLLVWLENVRINLLSDPGASCYRSCKVTQEFSCSSETNCTRRFGSRGEISFFKFHFGTSQHFSVPSQIRCSGCLLPCHEFQHRHPVSPYISLSSTKVFICHFYLLDMSWQYKVDR